MSPKCPKCGSIRKWIEEYGHCFACSHQVIGSLWRRLGKAAAVIEILNKALVSRDGCPGCGDAILNRMAKQEVEAYAKVEKAFDKAFQAGLKLKETPDAKTGVAVS